MSEERIFGFPPICGADARILVLGSMPSVASLAQQQYYAHPRNAFWRIQAALFEEPFAEDYAVRTERLVRHCIALWDSAASCVRPGSLDSRITDAVPNDIPGLLDAHPGIRHIFCNGGASYSLLLKFHKGLESRIPVTKLPSTSPAAAMFSFEEKLARWQLLLEELR